MERRESLMNRLHLFAEKHKGNDAAAEALMSFFQGNCIHAPDKSGKCELCGVQTTPN